MAVVVGFVFNRSKSVMTRWRVGVESVEKIIMCVRNYYEEVVFV